MRKIKIRSSDGQEVLELSAAQLKEIKESPKYEKAHTDLVAKAEKKLDRQIYFKQGFWKDLLLISIAALGTTVAFDYFVSATGKMGLFPGGLGGITRFISVIVVSSQEKQASLYFVFYFAFNIPFICFGFWKLGNKFTLTTVTYILLSICFDQIIRLIPVINPSEWHLIIDYQLINAIPQAWNSTIWLFIFAIFGGIILGWSYAVIYKASSSTGGTDFATVYFSQQRNKNIGKINMKINFIILTVVIILNTLMLKSEEFDESIKFSILNSHYSSVDIFYQAVNKNDICAIAIKELFGSGEITNLNLGEALRKAASDVGFTEYSTGMMNLMRFKFIFGPSLFASFTLIIAQALVVDFLYPKNKIQTIMITTIKSDEVQQYLFEAGYRNNVFIWEAETSKKGVGVTNKKVLMATVTVINWNKLEAGLINIDQHMNINVVKTQRVKGPFKYELDNERRLQIIHERVVTNDKWMKKIEHDAIFIANAKIKNDLKNEKATQKSD
ncbi:YitT family protein [Mesoplasma syrphidae]|uniref:YitT family protein n=1 Tax=Mesoplasma syrphidae TaxID=225999 RepID=A0A2K9BK45_9MOLU|nr:YitT family ABC transporter [Mesoplasma syrphidae]AUF83611.1 YitT family protein [Mesoplasma syrphidae]